MRHYDPKSLPSHLVAEYHRYGGLTAAQLRELEAPQASIPVPAVDVSHIVRAFDIAMSKGVKQPKVHVQGFVFKYATRGFTPGAIFVIDAEGFNEYLGKIYQGKFLPAPACTKEQKARILEVAADPLKAVLEFGRQTGRCSICNRPLTDPTSVAASIGPICREKFGL